MSKTKRFSWVAAPKGTTRHRVYPGNDWRTQCGRPFSSEWWTARAGTPRYKLPICRDCERAK